MMGAMALDLLGLERFPIYFYGQSYMGTLEVPLTALVAALGPEGWKYSVWPVRLTQLIYFVALCWIHFRLTARFFGPRAARWILFFLCVAPWQWMDFSSRMRHVTVMIFLGEAIALVSLGMIDSLRAGLTVRGRSYFCLGLLVGLAWWHYQLVLTFLLPVVLIFFLFSPILRLWLIRPGSEANGERPPSLSPRLSWTSLARLLLLSFSAISLASLSLGWARPYASYYGLLIGAPFLIFALGVCWSWMVHRRHSAMEGCEGAAPEHLNPALLFSGFVLATLPTLVFILRAGADFWPPTKPFDLSDLLGRFSGYLLVEVATVLEFTPTSVADRGEHFMSSWSYPYFLFYGLGIYVLGRSMFRGQSSHEKIGAVFFFSVFFCLMLINVLTPHYTHWAEARFFFPIFALSSVVLGLAVHRIDAALSAARFHPRLAAWAFASLVVMGSLWVWGSRWMAMRPERLDWPSGHRSDLVQLVDALRERNIQRVVTNDTINEIILGYEIYFASRRQIRCNRGCKLDRFLGMVDETEFKGEEYIVTPLPYDRIGRSRNFRVRASEVDRATAENAPKVGGYFFYPLPENFRILGRDEVL